MVWKRTESVAKLDARFTYDHFECYWRFVFRFQKCQGALRPGLPRIPCSAGAELGNFAEIVFFFLFIFILDYFVDLPIVSCTVLYVVSHLMTHFQCNTTALAELLMSGV